MKIHIVQKGDTLWKLSKKYGVSFEELKKANAQLSNPDMMMPGMKIKVPGTSGSVKKETIKPSVKEAPKQYTQPVKEQPMVTEPPFIQQPIVKEQPKPELYIQQPLAKEQPFPKEIVKEQPVMPDIDMEIDINNYYMVNIAKPPAPKMVEPEIIKEESPEMVAPVEYAPAPDCVPVTPIMPGTGFCLPYQPWAIPPVQQPFPQVQEWQDSCSDTSDMQYMPHGSGFYPYRQERGEVGPSDSSSFDQDGYGPFYGEPEQNLTMGGSYAPESQDYCYDAESSMESSANFMSTYSKYQQYPQVPTPPEAESHQYAEYGDYPQYPKVQSQYDHYPQAQPQHGQHPGYPQYPRVQSQHGQPEYGKFSQVQPQFEQYPGYPKVQSQYGQPEYGKFPQVQPQFEQFPEYPEYPKVQSQYGQPEYGKFPQVQPQFEQYPEYPAYPKVQSQYEQPEYEKYPESYSQHEQYPGYPQYPQMQPQYEQPAYGQFPGAQPQYPQYPQMHQQPGQMPGMPQSKDCGCGGRSPAEQYQDDQYQQMLMRFPQPEPQHNQGNEFHSVIDPYKPAVFDMPGITDESNGL